MAPLFSSTSVKKANCASGQLKNVKLDQLQMYLIPPA
jgi:hypothetical protein